MMGSKASISMTGGTAPLMTTPMRTEQKGSAALTTFANATEPAPREITVAKWPEPWKAARVEMPPTEKEVGKERPPMPRSQTGMM
jgi:hypothetical protein